MWHMIILYESKACVSTIVCLTMHETTTKSSLIFYLRQQLSTQENQLMALDYYLQRRVAAWEMTQ
jgi:hypothetical protein